MTRAGFVALIGPPNVGKSTLLNALVGEHLAAVTHKAQTTRQRIPGFWTRGDDQIVFVDTPGILDPKAGLQETMLAAVLAAIEGVDAVYWLADRNQPRARELEVLQSVARQGVPLLLVLTKSDLFPAEAMDRREADWAELAPWVGRYRVSATTGDGLEDLIAATTELLPEHPFFYPPDQLTDLNLRFLAAELIREACYEELGEELPYSIHVSVHEWKEAADTSEKTVIGAVIHVERDSQKGIVIGKGGRRLKAIGVRARASIEALLDAPVYLSLRVKVRPGWSRREADLRRFGYTR